jgi:glycosyltransferase involved in cell wall biosynthesis
MKIVIVSCHYSPGHTGHLKAWYQLSQKCGYETELYLDEQYVPYFGTGEYSYVTRLEELKKSKPDIAVLYNIGLEDIRFVKWCQKNNCRLYYVLHEPDTGIKGLLKHLWSTHGKNAAIFALNRWICSRSYRVILCSGYAEELCRNYMKETARKCVRFPLIFLDEYEKTVSCSREYFSLIGTYMEGHGSDRFLDFVKESEQRNDLKFQIVTRSSIGKELDNPMLLRMQEQGRLIVQQGRPLTEEEMNEAYRRSIAVWNGYRGSTQSGVLANAYMQGTPVVATHLGSFDEFVLEGRTGSFIPDLEYDSVMSAIEKIKDGGERMNEECRNFFRQAFYYENQKDTFQKIVEDVRGKG